MLGDSGLGSESLPANQSNSCIANSVRSGCEKDERTNIRIKHNKLLKDIINCGLDKILDKEVHLAFTFL